MKPFLGSDAASFLFLCLLILAVVLVSTRALPALGFEPWSVAARRLRAEGWYVQGAMVLLFLFLIVDWLILDPWKRP